MHHKVNSISGTPKCPETSTILQLEEWQLAITEGTPRPRLYNRTLSQAPQYCKMEPIRFDSTLQLLHIYGLRAGLHLRPLYLSHYKHYHRILSPLVGHVRPQSTLSWHRQAPRMTSHHNSRPPKTMFYYYQTSTQNNRTLGHSLPLISTRLLYNPLPTPLLPNLPLTGIDATTVEPRHLELFQ